MAGTAMQVLNAARCAQRPARRTDVWGDACHFTWTGRWKPWAVTV
jgi:hypothetical protein